MEGQAAGRRDGQNGEGQKTWKRRENEEGNEGERKKKEEKKKAKERELDVRQ